MVTRLSTWCASDACAGRCEEAGHRLEQTADMGWRRVGCIVHRRCTVYTPAAGGDGEASTAPAGQLLHRGRTWWCPKCLNGREMPSARCCKTALIAAETIVRRLVDAD